ncbi:MAG: Gfo/Idh/MocA family oxidoreductase [Silicimonas sp.]|nr:Gfo/Idh/MocA family oxidoreductase [Silicimonas sp.]
MAEKLALVGIGKIARDQHIPSIADTPALVLAATASRNPAATVDGVPAYPSLAALLEAAPEITAVSLATPPQARFADAALALAAGKHVMLEKPPGATLSEVHALEGLAAKAGVTLFATWHSREAAAVDAAREWLSDKCLISFHISWKEDVRHWHPGQDWIWEAGGLGVFDPGINALSVMTAILPAPVHLVSADLHFPANRDTPVSARLRFGGPAEVTAEFDWLEKGPPAWNIDIETREGKARLSQGGARFAPEGGEETAGANTEYRRLYTQFAKLIEEGASEVDLAPLRHVADAFMLGRRVQTDPFEW